MKLTRPLVVLDLETTGTWTDKDKIIEVALIRCEPSGEQKSFTSKVNPGMRIPAVVSELTGIKEEDVKEAPRFSKIAVEVLKILEGADLGGFNLERFDLPLLERELGEAGHAFDWRARTVYDAQKIYHINEKRDLSAAFNFFCNKDLEGAHSALVDTEATLAVLTAQVEKYGQGDDSIESLKDFDYRRPTEFYDAERKFRWWNGELYMMFGKYARKRSLKQVVENDRRYLEWIVSQNFSDEVKDLVEGALQGHFPSCPADV